MCEYSVMAVGTIIFFGGEITHVSMLELKVAIEEVIVESNSLTIYIDSRGGTPYQALGMADYITALIHDGISISTYICGEVSSSASIIALAADERFMSPQSIIYIHEFTSHVSGRPGTVISDGKECKRLNEVIARFYAECTDISLLDARAMLKDDTYIDRDMAREYGFVQ